MGTIVMNEPAAAPDAFYIAPTPLAMGDGAGEGASGSSASCSCDVTGVTADKDLVCVSETVTFTAEGECLEEATWSGDGVPAGSTGPSLTISWNQGGEKTVTVSCDGTSASATVTVLQVDIVANGEVVTNDRFETCVGKKVTLEARLTPELDGATYQWGIPNPELHNEPGYVKGYDLQDAASSLPSATVTPLPASDLQKKSFHLYWTNEIGGEGEVISVEVTVDGKTCSAQALALVARPSEIDITVVAKGVPGIRVYQDADGDWLLAYGDADDSAPITAEGMVFTGEMRAPTDCGGQIAFIQRATIVRGFKSVVGPTTKCYEIDTTGQELLDREDGSTTPFFNGQVVPIAASATASVTGKDSPTLHLLPNWVEAWVNEDFEDFLMFRPEGADSIWVTVRKLRWGWQARAERISTTPVTWQLKPGTAAVDPIQEGNSIQLPEWNGRIQQFADPSTWPQIPCP